MESRECRLTWSDSQIFKQQEYEAMFREQVERLKRKRGVGQKGAEDGEGAVNGGGS
jgi:hypothetical protein